MTVDQAKVLIRRLLGSYPQASATDPEVYITTLITLFVAYPYWAGEQAVEEVLNTSKFLPTRAEIRPILAQKVDVSHSIDQWDRQAGAQLEERKQIAAQRREEPLEHRAAVVERVQAEMAKAGMALASDRGRVDPGLAAADFKAQFGISDAQFNAIPNASDTWKRARVRTA